MPNGRQSVQKHNIGFEFSYLLILCDRCRTGGCWLLSGCRWLSPVDSEDRALLERNFASLRRSFPVMMVSCNLAGFLQAVHDVSSAWAQHLRESRFRSSLGDHHIPSSSTKAMWLLDGAWPVAMHASAACPGPATHPTVVPDCAMNKAAGESPAAPRLLCGGSGAAACPLQVPRVGAAAINAGEAVDAELPCLRPAWPDSGCGCPLDAFRLCDDDTEAAAGAGEEGSGWAAEEEEAWVDGGRWARDGGEGSESASVGSEEE